MCAMPLVSLTRLRLRSWRFLPGFFLQTRRSARQCARSPGFLAGRFATEGVRVFWTITAWRDEAAMGAYRSSDDHLRAMPRLLDWCDEASVAHWSQDDAELPDCAAAVQLMAERGRLSKVRHPSAGHAAGLVAPERCVTRPGPAIRSVNPAP